MFDLLYFVIHISSIVLTPPDLFLFINRTYSQTRTIITVIGSTKLSIMHQSLQEKRSKLITHIRVWHFFLFLFKDDQNHDMISVIQCIKRCRWHMLRGTTVTSFNWEKFIDKQIYLQFWTPSKFIEILRDWESKYQLRWNRPKQVIKKYKLKLK